MVNPASKIPAKKPRGVSTLNKDFGTGFITNFSRIFYPEPSQSQFEQNLLSKDFSAASSPIKIISPFSEN